MSLLRLWITLSVILSAVIAADARDVRLRGELSVAGSDSVAEAIADANVIVFQRDDSAFVKAVLTDDAGRFDLVFTPVKGHAYILRMSMTGFVPETVELADPPESEDLGRVALRRATELDELEVVADVPDVVQKGDTTVINAASFKVPEGSMLEELVKRIPGLEFDPKNYTMTYNGRAISEINVNGEVFFGGNTKLALTNLPVDIIEKIKVYNKQSDESKYTGLKDTTDNYVLDLNTKKSFDGVLTGYAQLTAGTEKRNGAGLEANCFKTNGDALSLEFSTGNLNSMSTNSRNRTTTGGLQFNKKFGNGLRINASLTADGNRGGDEGAEYSEQYLPGGSRYQNSISGSYFDNRSVSARLNLRWELDARTYLSLSSSYSHSDSENENNSRRAVFSEKPGLDLRDPFADIDRVDRTTMINAIESRSSSSSHTDNYSVHLRAVRRLNERGASISVGAGAGGDDNSSRTSSVSRTDFYRLTSYLGGDSVLYRNQLRESPGDNFSYNADAGFTYPVSDEFRINIAYSLRASRGRSTRSTYGFPYADAGQELPDNYRDFKVDSLSDSKRNRVLDHNISFYLEYRREPLLLSASLSAQYRRSSLDKQSVFNPVDTLINRVLLRPMVHAEWNKGDIRLDFHYDGSSRAPQISDLISVTDNSNPLYVVRANPDLRSSFTQNFRFGFNHTRLGLSASVSGSNEWNTIMRAVTYNPETGARTTEPRNISGNYSLNGMMRYYKRFGKFSMSANCMGGMVRSVSLVNEGADPEPHRSVTDIRNVVTSLTGSYMPQWGGFYLSTSWTGNFSTNSFTSAFTRTDVFAIGLSAFARLPFSFRISTNLDVGFRGGNYVYAGRRNTVMWHAEFCRTFFNQKFEVGLKLHDILNQKTATVVNSTATSFSETYSDIIGGYCLLYARYRFSTSKDNKSSAQPD